MTNLKSFIFFLKIIGFPDKILSSKHHSSYFTIDNVPSLSNEIINTIKTTHSLPDHIINLANKYLSELLITFFNETPHPNIVPEEYEEQSYYLEIALNQNNITVSLKNQFYSYDSEMRILPIHQCPKLNKIIKDHSVFHLSICYHCKNNQLEIEDYHVLAETNIDPVLLKSLPEILYSILCQTDLICDNDTFYAGDVVMVDDNIEIEQLYKFVNLEIIKSKVFSIQ